VAGGDCNEQLEKVMTQQSQELDAKKRIQLVAQIQRTLEDEAARPTVGWRMEYYTHWNYVKNLIPHQSIYNWGRMQEVWLDK